MPGRCALVRNEREGHAHPVPTAQGHERALEDCRLAAVTGQVEEDLDLAHPDRAGTDVARLERGAHRPHSMIERCVVVPGCCRSRQ